MYNYCRRSFYGSTKVEECRSQLLLLPCSLSHCVCVWGGWLLGMGGSGL